MRFKIIYLLLLMPFAFLKAQVLFSDDFSTLNLQNDVQVIGSKTISTTYTTAPSAYTLIEDGYKNNVGTSNSPNRPFNVASLKTTGWAVLYNSAENDTFLVSTSWLDTSVAVKRFIVSPVINNITANTVLSWEAMSPDVNFPEGYEVYVTTNTTGTLNANSFLLSDRVFYLADGNTAGAGEKGVWTKRGISLSQYAGQNVRVAFKNISQNMYQLWLDNIRVEDNANQYDAEISEGQGVYRYNTINTNGNINCRITNRGRSGINSVSLNYQIQGITNYQQAFGLSQIIPIHGNNDFTFNVPYNISVPGYYPVKIWVNYVNGFADQNNSNDTLYTSLSIMTSPPAKNVMVEQFLSAFDGYSPDGQDKLTSLVSSSVVAVNIHDGDSLKNSSVTDVISAYRKKTTTAVIDRNYFNDITSVPVERAAYSSRINQRKAAVVPVSVAINNKSYSSSTRELTFSVQASFASEVKGDYRINAYITENNVFGLGSDTSYNGWNQLSFMYNVPFSAYYQKGYYLASAGGYVLKAFEYKHQNVLDTALDGSFGAAGIIPTNGGTVNQSFGKAYTYTVPVAAGGVFRYNPDNMYIVAFVSEYNANKNKRTVLNCYQAKVTAGAEMVTVQELKSQANFILYPNPTSGLTHVLIPEGSFKNKVKITLIDITGKEVYVNSTDMRFGLLDLNLYHLENGSYFIHLTDGESSRTQKLILVK